MSVEARFGLLHDRVFADGTEYEVRRGRHGFHLIVDPDGAAGRVHYDGWRDRLSIDSPHGSLEIRFRWRHTTFPWRGRVYRVGSTLGSRVRVFEGERRVLEGKETWSGIRFDVISRWDSAFGPKRSQPRSSWRPERTERASGRASPLSFPCRR